MLSKLKHTAVRFAGLFHGLDRVTGAVGPDAPVAAGHTDLAAGLVWYFEAHGRRCLGVGDRATEPARRVLEALARWAVDRFTKRELHRRLRGQSAFHRATSLDAPLALLVHHGYLAPVDAPVRGTGRPAERFAVNPGWDRAAGEDRRDNMDKTPESPRIPGEFAVWPRPGHNPDEMDKTPAPAAGRRSAVAGPRPGGVLSTSDHARVGRRKPRR